MDAVQQHPTLVLSPRYTPDSQALWRAAIQRGWHVQRLTHWTEPPPVPINTPVVLYLEGGFAHTIAESLGLNLPEPPDTWLPQLPIEYRQRQIQLTTIAAAQALLPAFVKPPNDKRFPAKVYLSPAELPVEAADLPVLMAEVVVWEKEFRCFVLDRQLRTASLYARYAAPQDQADFASTAEEHADLEQFLQRLFDDELIELPRAVVIDVGVIAGRGWAVVELNAAWGAGIYGCDPMQVLEVVRSATEPL
ncbi:ATP-grasp domain-containing protein [Herpetosiphon llansteffanensis]